MKTVNSWLVVAIIVPVVLLFWPFAMWNDTMNVVLRVIPSLAAQVLLCRVGRWNFVKVIPAVLTGAFAAWGTYLYCTSPHWSNVTFWGGLIADYASPFISCGIILIVYLLLGREITEFRGTEQRSNISR